ncbi:hypothetical protein H9652_03680 [Oerskovia sp. Sa4CUA1]|uniref:Collagen-like protein n=1 Tax=Oerskovia rustica TaxID=2762237 RepID=A0ABR8RNY5_9CELL|nr:hypothetical protein [Oerskovia rustica]
MNAPATASRPVFTPVVARFAASVRWVAAATGTVSVRPRFVGSDEATVRTVPSVPTKTGSTASMTTGAVGSSGTTGFSGSVGSSGTTGVVGSSGTTGVSGSVGSSGVTGASGSSARLMPTQSHAVEGRSSSPRPISQCGNVAGIHWPFSSVVPWLLWSLPV